jgi:hypothetical protein
MISFLPYLILMPLLVLLGLVLLVYVGGPVLVRLTLTQAAEPRLLPFPVDHPDLRKDAEQTFQAAIAQLRPVGFEPIAGLAMPDQPPNVKLLQLFLGNRPAKDSAVVTITYTNTVTQGATEPPQPWPRARSNSWRSRSPPASCTGTTRSTCIGQRGWAPSS